MFEIVKRDGLARIGRLEIRGKVLETPALLPVVNPKIFTVTARELHDEFGFNALITNSYIIRNNKDLNEKATAMGLHEMLDFPGLVMTDSGTFQSHMYGEVELKNEEIIEFQRSIGSDIGTVLDIFAEPFWTKDETYNSIGVTLERTAIAASMKGDMSVAGVVQGSVYPDLREMCASEMRKMDVDVHPIGGVVPLMEQYRYSELVDVIIASKKGLEPNRPVHLFGAGHPMLLSLAVLLGCDMFDSASYAKFARDDRMMFIDGTFRLQDMQSLDCDCPACRGHDLDSLRKLDSKSRTKLIARHNLYEIRKELNLVKRYIREGRLWELAEQRCRSHPALLDALRKLSEHREFMESYDPISRDGAMFYTGPESRNRPQYLRYQKRLDERYIPWSPKAAVFEDSGSKPYSRHYHDEYERIMSSGYVPVVMSPFGPVPAELDEIYPLAQSLFPEISDMETTNSKKDFESQLRRMGFTEIKKAADIRKGDERNDLDMIRAVATARYQFGNDAAMSLFRGTIELVKSRNTGKIRNIISDGEHVLSMRAGDGLYTLRKEGAARILKDVPKPFMRVVVDKDAEPFVSEGRNAFPQFIISCDPSVRLMDEVILVNGKDELLAVGRAMLTPWEMSSFRKGVAVKVRDGSSDKS